MLSSLDAQFKLGFLERAAGFFGAKVDFGGASWKCYVYSYQIAALGLGWVRLSDSSA